MNGIKDPVAGSVPSDLQTQRCQVSMTTRQVRPP